MIKNLKANLIKAGAAVGAGATALLASGMAAHAQIMSATDGATIVTDTTDEVKAFLLVALPAVLGGLVILAWVFKLYHRVARGR